MEINRTETYTHIKPSTNIFSEFYNKFKEEFSKFEREHLIIDFSDIFNINEKDILLFLDISKQHKKNKMSFVLVANGMDADDFPEELSIVPTLTEAKDILEMDAIERDLGF